MKQDIRFLRHIRAASLSLTIFFCLTGGLPGPATADPFIPVFEELAPGVWTGVRDINPRFPVMGTTTFVITEDGVVVFDGGGVALWAERIIEKIRSLTDLPITHVIISHWHGDHAFGIHRYLEEYQNVQVIAHRFTDAVMHGTRIDYIKRQPAVRERLIPYFEGMLEKGVDEFDQPLADELRVEITRILNEDFDLIEAEYKRTRLTLPTILLDDKITIISGEKTIDIRYLGDGNTAGDIVMWLPEDKIVATGDIVVHPIPYGFNMPPLAWARTMRNINALGYETLVPGHGEIQRNTDYVDLLIREAEDIAEQRDRMIAAGISEEDAIGQFDYSAYEPEHTGGSDYYAYYYRAYFKDPFNKAAFKALKGIPMVLPNVEE